MEHTYIIGGNVKWYKHFGKQMAVSYKHTLIIRPAIKRKTDLRTKTCSQMFIAALFIIAQTGNW